MPHNSSFVKIFKQLLKSN